MAKAKAKPKYPHCEAAAKYVSDVLSGVIPACKWVKLACQRQLGDLEKVKNKDYPFKFDQEKGEKVCRFIEALPHIKGKWAGAREDIKLEPWQQFIWTTVFGWVRKSDGLRRFREMYQEVPRKNSKSTQGAAVGLFLLVEDGETGAEIYSGATTEKQAWEVFKPARLMAKKADGFQDHYGIHVGAANISILDTASKFEPLIGNPGDGASPHCAIIDEFHEHKSPEQYDTMITGMGARTQPLMLVITTAGSNLSGPCYDKRSQITKILQGIYDNDEIFGIIYTLDEAEKDAQGKVIRPEDDWTDFEVWKKANPNFGVSVFEDYLRARHKEALQRASRQNIIRCKHLNQWMNADTAWMNMAAWRACAEWDLKRERFAGQTSWLGLDLATKIDLAAMAQLFTWKDDNDYSHYAVFLNHYLPEEQAEPEDRAHYAGWAKEGWITLTPGQGIDYGYIKEDMRELSSDYQIEEVLYDPFNATQLSIEMLEEGFKMVECRPTVLNFSEPMKELEKLVLSGRFHHNGDPVLTWMVSNVVCHTDAKDNIYPRKERAENKIDGVIAVLMCLNMALRHQTFKSNYENEGLYAV